MTQPTIETETNSKLLKGILIGGLVGGALTLLDSNKRNKVKRSAILLKDNSVNMIEQVKENPDEVKEQMVSDVKEATSELKGISSKAVVAGKQLKETPAQSLKDDNKKGEKESDELVTKSELSNEKSISSNF
ncbi:hypothetical protein [Peribacillus butanolivorans]|uniref:hypothetical protein n=1 Tax=Peribacillus butanolivorans TaxID=421767 RepID=UPI0006A6DE21|nr:hypothetical protein [Peribacillus butanolivorans]